MNPAAPAPPRIRPTWLQIAVLAAIGPILLGAVAFWMGDASYRSSQARAEITRAFEYRREVELLASLLKDAETSQRGYLISGKADFLEPYRDARSELSRQLHKVASLTPKTARNLRELDELRRTIDAKFTEMQKLIEVRNQSGLDVAAAELAKGVGKRQMDHIRSILGTITDRTTASIAQAQKLDNERGSRVRSILWTGEALFALAAGAIGFFLGRGRRARNLLALQREEAAARQRAIFESAVDAIVLINPSGSIETINPAAEQLFGYGADEVLRRDISTLIDLAPGEGPFLARLGLHDGRFKRTNLMDVDGRNRQGEPIFVDVTLGVMPLPDGIHVVATLRDATARKEFDRLKDDFISTVSHELRTPLTSIVGSLGLLRGGAAGALPSAAQRLTDIAESNSQRLIRLINDILDVDQIRKGKMSFDYAVMDLREVVRKTVQTMGGLAERAGVTLDVRLPDTPANACADSDRLVQAAGNLLSNAIKFSPAGSTVTIELISASEDHIFQITDQGPGIDPEFAKHIFNRFSQANRPGNQMIAGTGLGLAISREIVRHHGGDISFENRAGGGARFAFSVPRDQLEADATPPDARLLICNDDEDAGRTIQSILAAHGYPSDLVRTSDDAIEHLRKARYDVLLLGLRERGEAMDILEVMESDTDRRRLPVIIISTISPPSDFGFAFAGWLQKPYDPRRLVQLVQRAIRGRTHQQAVVLHVDDDADSRELFGAALAGRSQILGASSLAEARAVLNEREVDAVVLDLGLPDGSGEALLKELRAPNKRIPVVLYSAQEVSEQARKSADAVFVKSRRSLAKLASTVVEIVDRRDQP